jgi:hypothetical protein
MTAAADWERSGDAFDSGVARGRKQLERLQAASRAGRDLPVPRALELIEAAAAREPVAERPARTTRTRESR